MIRFYPITDIKEENTQDDATQTGPPPMQRWIIRFDRTAQGSKLRAAMLLLYSADVLSNAAKASIRTDRGPKRGLLRGPEGVIEGFLGKREPRRR